MFFDLASLTKPLTALACVRAGMDPAVPLAEFVPEWRGCGAGGCTLGALLGHRAGLPTTAVPPWPVSASPVAPLGRDDARAWLARLADVVEPSAPPAYGCVGYLLVGYALARRCGAEDAGEAIESLVIEPLGLGAWLGTARGLSRRSPAWRDRCAPTEYLAHRGGLVCGAVHDDAAWALAGHGAAGNAGLFGTVGAVLRLAHAVLLARGRGTGPLAYPSPDWTFEAPVGVRANGSGAGFSYRSGWDGKSAEGSSAGTVLGPRTVGHLGFTGTSLWLDPDAGIAVCLLTNRVCPTRENVEIRAFRPVAHDALATAAVGRRPGPSVVSVPLS
jgi:CubicO group peptidase (beta-lactamase class C family)